jgi:AcrR family transcriptional regulator
MATRQLRQLRAHRTRRALIAAAARVFAERGYDHATVDDIARAAGVSKGAYYFHFDSKEETLLALVDDWVRRRTTQIDGTEERHGDIVGALRSLLDGGDAKVTREIHAQAERNPHVRALLADAYTRWQESLAARFRQAQAANLLRSDVPAEDLAAAALALRDGGLLLQRLDGVPDLSRAADAFTTLLVALPPAAAGEERAAV